MIRLLSMRSAFALFGLLALVAVGALANGAIKMRPAADEDHRLAVVAVPGYHVALFTLLPGRRNRSVAGLGANSVGARPVSCDYAGLPTDFPQRSSLSLGRSADVGGAISSMIASRLANGGDGLSRAYATPYSTKSEGISGR